MPKWGRKRPRRLIFAVGLYTVGAGLYDIFYPAVTQNFRDAYNLRERYGAESWVVVSGATNELGQQFAHEFTKQGFNLVLIDENQENLEKLKGQLAENNHIVQLQTMQFDLKKSQNWKDYDELCNKIKEITKEKELSVLVNNAEEFDPFGPKIHKADDQLLLGTLTINTFPVVFLTRFLGTDMKSRQKKSAIINLTSYYSEYNVQNSPIYSSTKAYQDVFSQILGYENQDLDVLTVKNMPYKTERHPNGVDPKQIVEGVMKDLGHERISYGHWTHAAFRYWILLRQCQFWFSSCGPSKASQTKQ
ncbi:short chain dehydrogenase reductase family protein [Stylonychia lemnae]|uniref:Short chain dehydrogenase reductase family protein n=1 Tax=Stylonychia lemnae TaxID=5949 RepID=A0A078ABR0_STYLE|nr:short chain dehydrogenase reductase family protein [Stylonychia lemnae]|eukprot:CDW79730.1 short chain dehydrogenase reductase family protein [Stylonychia lemnae]